MKKSFISAVFKILIIAFAFIGLYACAIWYPITILSKDLFEASQDQIYQGIIQLIFYLSASVPCFVILFYAWRIARAIKNDTIFTYEIAGLIKKCTAILLIDDIFFIVGNTVFLLLGWSKYVFYYFIIAAVGLVASCVLYVLFYYANEAAELKEEIDLTI